MTADVARREACTIEMLRRANLRPTRQRVVLAFLLFGSGDRHVTAESLHDEVVNAGEKVSLATVYNTLHQFRQVGLLRELAIEGAKNYFDTNTSNHSHFFDEQNNRLIDIPDDAIKVDGLPAPPDGMRVSHVDVVVRLVKA
ncbi:MAG: iron response transcriptional regulator IrrA [Hyphomicrobiaceae bacterium]